MHWPVELEKGLLWRKGTIEWVKERRKGVKFVVLPILRIMTVVLRVKEQYWPLIWFFHFSRVKKPVIRSVHVLITQMKAIKQYLLQGGAIWFQQQKNTIIATLESSRLCWFCLLRAQHKHVTSTVNGIHLFLFNSSFSTEFAVSFMNSVNVCSWRSSVICDDNWRQQWTCRKIAQV